MSKVLSGMIAGVALLGLAACGDTDSTTRRALTERRRRRQPLRTRPRQARRRLRQIPVVWVEAPQRSND